MTRLELLNKSDELTVAWMDKKAKLDNYVQKWSEGKVQMSDKGIQQLVDSATQQIEQLKNEAAKYKDEYMRITQEEAVKRNAVISVKHNFGTSPEQLVIEGGVLSSNANESHLIGRKKTQNELEEERTQLLDIVRDIVIKEAISLADASKLVQIINMLYDNYIYGQENTQGSMKR